MSNHQATKKNMIRIFVMQTCPDCTKVKLQASGDQRFELIDIGEHVRNLKLFLNLRDSSPAFVQVKRNGSIGIPCFVLEDGTVTFSSEEAGLMADSHDTADAPACNIDGTGC